MKKIKCAAIVFSFLIGGASLVGCQHSAHRNYYYLNTVASEPPKTQQSTDNITNVVGIGPIEIADYLNRSQIVYNDASNNISNTLTVSENDFWAEPLDKGIARVITLNLTQRNNNRSFVNFPWRSDSKPRYSLRVKINSLMRNNDEASINATWELLDNDAKTTRERRNFIRTTPVKLGAKNLAQSYSKLFSELSVEMDDALSRQPQ